MERTLQRQFLGKCRIPHDQSKDFEIELGSAEGAAKALRGGGGRFSLTSLKLIETIRVKSPFKEFVRVSGDFDAFADMIDIAEDFPFVMVATDLKKLEAYLKKILWMKRSIIRIK